MLDRRYEPGEHATDHLAFAFRHEAIDLLILTSEAEFLYDCVAHTVEHDLPREIEFLRCQDEAETRLKGVVDMPDRLIRNLLMFMRQNDGLLSKRRRDGEFAALTDAEARAIEEIYRDVFGSG